MVRNLIIHSGNEPVKAIGMDVDGDGNRQRNVHRERERERVAKNVNGRNSLH